MSCFIRSCFSSGPYYKILAIGDMLFFLLIWMQRVLGKKGLDQSFEQREVPLILHKNALDLCKN